MGGDHKCPVCQATFTRPQHVARHMRSHTGDRPYKCQYCGDQFARSDLLSRHVNKCHSNEKPIPVTGSRRKGTTSATRATTSKQACDQCVQSSIPCDGSNPCSKCVQRKCRCTYVKFHRQTAPTGPGHNNPPSTVTPSSSSRIAPYPSIRHPVDDFSLTSQTIPNNPNLFSDSFSFSPIYPTSSSIPEIASTPPDYATRYRIQADLLRRNALAASIQDDAPVYTDIPRSQHPSNNVAGTWPAWQQDDPSRYHDPNDNTKDLQAELSRHFSSTNNQAFQATNYLIHHRRRQSLEFSGSDGSSTSHSVPSSAGSSSPHLPMMDTGPSGHPPPYHHQHQHQSPRQHQAYPTSTLPESGFGQHRLDHQQQQAPSDSRQQQQQQQSHHQTQEGGFDSAFGLMSLDGPAVLAGLSTDGAPFFSQAAAALGMDSDPDATPMQPPHQRSQQPHPNTHQITLQQRPNSQPHSQQHLQPLFPQPLPPQGLTTPSRDIDARELREFWKQYMRTPLSGPGPSGSSGLYTSGTTPSASASSINGTGNGNGNNNNYRRPRVNSLPSVKTPGVGVNNNNTIGGFGGGGGGYMYGSPPPGPNYSHLYPQQQQQQQQQSQQPQFQGIRRPSSTTTRPQQQQQQQQQHTHGTIEDLRSYEAAVLARKAPTTLNLNPKRRGTVGGSAPGLGPPGSASASAGTSPQVPHSGGRGGGSGAAAAAAKFRGGSAGPSVGNAGAGDMDIDTRSGGISGSPSSLAHALGKAPGGSTSSITGAGAGAAGGGGGMRVMFAPTPSHTPISTSSRSSGGYGSGSGRGSTSPGNDNEDNTDNEHVRSRESSVAFSDGSGGGGGGEPSQQQQQQGGDGSMGLDGDGLRPSFKRLPSQTLGPVNAKRAQLMHGGVVGGVMSEEDTIGGGDVSGRQNHLQHLHHQQQQQHRQSVTLAERRRRMSAPSGTSPTAPDFDLESFTRGG